MQNDFKNIQIEIEEKTKTNKKLLEDFNHLLFYLEKEIEIVEKLKKEKEVYTQSNQDLYNEKNNFGQNMYSLNNSKNEYLKELEFLTKENNILNQQIQAEQNEIDELEQEKNKYININKEMKLKNCQKINVIKLNDDAINYFQKQLNNSNITINKMINMINELEKYYKSLQNQYEESNTRHKIVENKKFNNDKIYQELIDNIKKKEGDINNNISVLDSISGEKEQLYNYNTKIYNDLDRLQNHIYELSQQNEKLVEKIAKYQKIEEMINNHILSKKEMNDKLNEEQNFIENKIGIELKKYFEKDNLNIKENNQKINDKNKELENNFFENNSKNNLNSNSEIEIKNNNIDNINSLNNNENEIILEQSENNLSEKRNINLFDEHIKKRIDNNINYLEYQKELQLENEYE